MEEQSIIVDGDVLIGNYVDSSFGFISDTFIAGEHVKIDGNIISEKDISIDMWSEITGEVRTKTDIFLGEFVKIHGKLFTTGNLDVGNNVKILGGYDVKGWIVVRNPLPVVMFIYFYMVALLHISNNEKEFEKAIQELFSEDIQINKVMTIPSRTKITLEEIKTSSFVKIGNNCKIIGNIRGRKVSVGKSVVVFGNIRSKGNISINDFSKIYGSLESRKIIKIGRGCVILGKISADSIMIHETAKIESDLSYINKIITIRDELNGLNDIEKNIFYGMKLIFL